MRICPLADTQDLHSLRARSSSRERSRSRPMEVPASSSRDYSSWEYVGQRPRRVPHEDTIDPDEPQIKQARRAKRREGARLVPEWSPCVVGRTYCA